MVPRDAVGGKIKRAEFKKNAAIHVKRKKKKGGEGRQNVTSPG
jgi:hypothetical protein